MSHQLALFEHLFLGLICGEAQQNQCELHFLQKTNLVYIICRENNSFLAPHALVISNGNDDIYFQFFFSYVNKDCSVVALLVKKLQTFKVGKPLHFTSQHVKLFWL